MNKAAGKASTLYLTLPFPVAWSSCIKEAISLSLSEHNVAQTTKANTIQHIVNTKFTHSLHITRSEARHVFTLSLLSVCMLDPAGMHCPRLLRHKPYANRERIHLVKVLVMAL